MKFSKWLRILAVSGCIAATAVSAGGGGFGVCEDVRGPPPYRQERSAVPILKGAEAGLIKKRWMHSMRI